MIWLVRHPPVALHWQKRCYGSSDMGLSREGSRLAKALIAQVAELSPDLIIHSDRKRTRIIAQRLAGHLSAEIQGDHRWRERDFGDWEGRSWDEIYRATGNTMDGMLYDPNGFRPGGGETTRELINRALDGWRALPGDRKIAIITHGGPIAAIRAHLNKAPVQSMPDYIPPTGSITEIR